MATWEELEKAGLIWADVEGKTWAELGTICEVVSGTTPKTNNPEFWDGDVDWITPAELTDDSRIIYESQRKITRKAVKSVGLKPFPAGTVILSSRAPIGKVAIAGIEMYCNQGFKNLICSDAVYNKYLFWYLKSKTDYLNSLGRGATFKEISKGIVENIKIRLPPLKGQRYIADVLDKLSKLIALRKQQLAKLDELVKARFVEMFGDSKTNPKHWAEKELHTLANVGSSKRVFVEELQDNGIPFYRGTEIGALATGETVVPELFITPEHCQELCDASGTPRRGDLLMPSICPDGRIWLVDTDAPFYFKDGRVLWVHPTNECIESIYLLYALREKIITDYLNIASGTTFAELKIFALKDICVMVPPIELQKKFAAFIQIADIQRLTVQQGLDKLEVLKKALMQEYFG